MNTSLRRFAAASGLALAVTGFSPMTADAVAKAQDVAAVNDRTTSPSASLTRAARPGVVTVEVKRGRLVITGSATPQRIKVVRNAKSVEILVSGKPLSLGTRLDPADIDRVRVRARGGNDRVTIVEKDGLFDTVVLQGGSGDDKLKGGAGVTRLLGRRGDDRLVSGGGRTTMDGNGGDDVLLGGSRSNTMNGGDGEDTLVGGGGANFIYGNDGDDDIRGGAGTNRMSGGNQNDTVIGGTGLNQMNGGSQDDTLIGGSGINKMYGGNNDDSLVGGPGSDLLNGGGGDDVLRQSAGSDSLAGLDGSDQYLLDADVAAGTVTIEEAASAGIDTVSAAATTTTGVSLDLSLGSAQVVSSALTVQVTANTIEHVFGGSLNDVLTGNRLANEFTGGGGADTFVHQGPGDSIDTVTDMSAAAGDRVSFGSAGVTPYQLDLDATGTKLRDIASRTFGFDFNAAVRGTGVVTFGIGGGSAPGALLTSGADTDVDNASANADSLLTSFVSNAKVIAGGSGRDRIVDLSNNANTLIGRGGDDNLTGGAGADTFVMGVPSPSSTTLEAFGNDVVTDFANTDTIDLPAGLSVRSGLGTTVVTIWDGVSDFGTISASSGRNWTLGSFT